MPACDFGLVVGHPVADLELQQSFLPVRRLKFIGTFRTLGVV